MRDWDRIDWDKKQKNANLLRGRLMKAFRQAGYCKGYINENIRPIKNGVGIRYQGLNVDISLLGAEGTETKPGIKVVFSSEFGLKGIEDYVSENIIRNQIFQRGETLGRVIKKRELQNYMERLELIAYGFVNSDPSEDYFLEYALRKIPENRRIFRETIYDYVVRTALLYARVRNSEK